MSFLSVLKKIGTVAIGVERIAAPVLNTFYPPFVPIDNMFLHLQAAIATVEQSHPTGEGGLKAAAVKADFIAGLQVTQDVLAMNKQQLVYDEAALAASIDAQVAAFNAMAKLKASFKTVAL